MPEQYSTFSLFDEEEIMAPAPKSKQNRRKHHLESPQNISDTLVTIQSIDLFPDYQFDESIINLTDSTPEELLEEDLSFSEFDYETDYETDYEEDTNLSAVSDEEAEHALTRIGLSAFLSEIGQIKILTREEETSLFQEYAETKSEEIRNKIICCNIKLIVAVAKKIFTVNSKMEFEDMIDEGVLGLIRAIEKFELKRGNKFSTYAFQWIRQAISRAIANTSDIIRVPVHFSDNLSKIRKFENEYLSKHGGDVVPEEITSKALGIPLDKIHKYKSAAQQVGSLDKEIIDDNITAMDVCEDKNCVNPEEKLVTDDVHAKIMEKLYELSDIERIVIMNKFGLCEKTIPISKLATKLKISRTRIKDIEEKVLPKLATPEMYELLRAI